MRPEIPRCGGCGKAQVRLDTDRMGRLVEIPTPCRCAHWRRLNCVCRHCDRPVTGKPKVALYCDHHRKQALARSQKRYNVRTGYAATKRYQQRNRKKLAEKANAYYAADPARRARKDAIREAWRHENRETENARRRAWYRENRDAVLAYQRQYRAEVKAGLRAPKVARRNSFGERLCETPDCRAVMRGRERKCGPCKVAAREAAVRAVLEPDRRRAA